MYGKHKTRTNRKGDPFPTNTTTTRCIVSPMSNSSKRVEEATLTCCGCKHEFLVPTTTTAHRCYICLSVSNSISVSVQSTKGSRAKLFTHDQLNNANTNGASLRSSSSAAGSSSSLSTPCNKRAVICGVTYGKRKFKLEGTMNDVINMTNLLVDKFKFPIGCIRVLTEEQKDPNLIPTKRNILESLNWLVKDCQPKDSLVFYFSGHGLQQPEHDKGDEIDGLDEAICPVDFLREGMITDNEINSTIVKPLKKDVTLHAIIDACHSGTTLDLTYVYQKEKDSWKWKDNRSSHSKEPIVKHTSGGLAICLSACEDSQMAGDSAVRILDILICSLPVMKCNALNLHSHQLNCEL
ncbi:Metacaspase-1 protein [Spatholobus suberectus]|nr:Metacaspase-1 protein [Spatholobus suberectus]